MQKFILMNFAAMPFKFWHQQKFTGDSEHKIIGEKYQDNYEFILNNILSDKKLNQIPNMFE